MKCEIRFRLIASLAIGFGLATMPINAEEKQAEPSVSDIRNLMNSNGTADIANQLGPLAAQQVLVALRRINPSLPSRADAIVTDVVVTYLRQAASRDRVVEKLIPIYAKHLTKEDVIRITKFYRSPTGRKLMSVMPAISLESARVGQQWVESILPGLQMQLLSRLRSEKLIE